MKLDEGMSHVWRLPVTTTAFIGLASLVIGMATLYDLKHNNQCATQLQERVKRQAQIVGPPGLPGYPGPPGAVGFRGATGPTGLAGRKGPDATIRRDNNGRVLVSGRRGSRGVVGPPGRTGATGMAGYPLDGSQNIPQVPVGQNEGQGGQQSEREGYYIEYYLRPREGATACTLMPCINGGICIDNGHDFNYDCYCKFPWTGQNCVDQITGVRNYNGK